MMRISDKGISLIKQFEGLRLTAYQDSVGVWTIGYGWTQPVDGKPIRLGMTIKEETAERLLRTGLVGYESDVSKLVKVKLTQGQFDALVSFAYNLGARALSTSTLLQKLNAGDYAGAADEFLRWNKAGGKVLPGLTRRREAERALFLSDSKK
ncbi:lysozyme [Kosakonia cowanii]